MARLDFPKTKDVGEVLVYLQNNPIKVFRLGSYFRGFNIINALAPRRPSKEKDKGMEALEILDRFEIGKGGRPDRA